MPPPSHVAGRRTARAGTCDRDRADGQRRDRFERRGRNAKFGAIWTHGWVTVRPPPLWRFERADPNGAREPCPSGRPLVCARGCCGARYLGVRAGGGCGCRRHGFGFGRGAARPCWHPSDANRSQRAGLPTPTTPAEPDTTNPADPAQPADPASPAEPADPSNRSGSEDPTASPDPPSATGSRPAVFATRPPNPASARPRRPRPR